MSPRHPDIHIATTAKERAALSSPIRLEILGSFISADAMSIADIAERMGRPAASLYYHFRIMEDAGILRRTGSRPGTKKSEALYLPVATRFAISVDPESPSTLKDAIKTVSHAFRLAERDFEAALTSGQAKATGKHRNTYATRVHCRINKNTLAEINKHFSAVEKILMREARRSKLPPDADQYLSLTLALLPLRGRGEE